MRSLVYADAWKEILVMKHFLKVETLVRKMRDSFIRSVFQGKSGRKRHLTALDPNVVLVTKKMDDHILTFNPHEFIGKKLYVEGVWERETVFDVVSILEKKGLLTNREAVVELGANIGTQTLYLHLTKLFKRIIAVEADPFNADLLELNMKQNGFLSNTSILPIAIGAEDGVITLYRREGNQGAHSVIPHENSTEAIDIPMTSLPTLLDQTGIKVNDIAFFWVDLEGIEFEIIQHVIDVVGTRVPIFTEFTPLFYGAEKTADFKDYLKDHYETCYLFSRSKKPREISVQNIPVDVEQIDLLLYP